MTHEVALQTKDMDVLSSSSNDTSRPRLKLKGDRLARRKLRQRTFWPVDLAALAGAPPLQEEQHTPFAAESAVSWPGAVKRFIETPSIAANLGLEVYRREGGLALDDASLPRTEGKAYPQWIILDGLERGIEMVVPLSEAAKKLTVTVQSAGVPMPAVEVRVQVSERGFVRGLSDENGRCLIGIPKRAAAKIAVSARPRHSHWSAMDLMELAGTPVDIEVDLELEPLHPNLQTYVETALGALELDHGEGVKVAVIDSGWSEHSSLPNYAKGACTVAEDPAPDDLTDTLGHGTMVAGLIGARGDGVTQVRGIAPGVQMVAYRVFPHGSVETDGAAISEAIRKAVDDGCDVINISIGGLQEMPSAAEEIKNAWGRGVVCIVAAGNLFRQPVLYPARYPGAIAVSAMGRKDAYPGLSLFSLCETSDSGTDENNYLPDFTNVGSELALCTPGVGIVSTFLGNTIQSSKGTSFAAPVAAGILARLLSLPSGVSTLKMPRTDLRSEAMRRMLEQAAVRFGFAVTDCEGRGMPR